VAHGSRPVLSVAQQFGALALLLYFAGLYLGYCYEKQHHKRMYITSAGSLLHAFRIFSGLLLLLLLYAFAGLCRRMLAGL